MMKMKIEFSSGGCRAYIDPAIKANAERLSSIAEQEKHNAEQLKKEAESILIEDAIIDNEGI